MKKPPETPADEPQKNPGTSPDGKIIKSVGDKPCGCRITEYSDGSKLYAPCVPCGLFAVADNLNQSAVSQQQAAQALASVATRMQQMQTAAHADMVSRAAKNVVVKP